MSEVGGPGPEVLTVDPATASTEANPVAPDPAAEATPAPTAPVPSPTLAAPEAVDPATAAVGVADAIASGAGSGPDANPSAAGSATPGGSESGVSPEPPKDQVAIDKEFIASLPPKEKFETLMGMSKNFLKDALSSGIFDTPEKKTIVDAALADLNDSKSVMAALKIAQEAAAASGSDNAARIAANMEDVAAFIKVSHNGAEKPLSELMVERAQLASDPAKQKEVDAIDDAINNGTRTADFKIVPDKYEGKTPEEIDGMVLDDGIAFLEKKIKEAGEDEDTSVDKKLLEAAKAAKNAKGYRGLFTVGTIKALQSHFSGMKGAEELILQPEVMEALAPAEQAAIKEYLNDALVHAGIDEARARAMLDLVNNGDFTEFMKLPLNRVLPIVNKLYGTDHKTQDAANEYVDKVLKLLEEEKYKNLKMTGKGIGGLAVLMLLLANALKEGVGTAIGPGQ